MMATKSIQGWLFIVLSLLCSVSIASHYFPPERMNCWLDLDNKPYCEGLNHNYLKEHITNANLKRDKSDIFYFYSASAYISPNNQETQVFYNYKNKLFQMLNVVTVNQNILPDFTHGTWKKVADDLYTCDASYMNCPINHLPE